ncbi:MgtC/SapB family protein [Aneurinibacillus sp. REN35]|uniref:MgtC/SapB family protein n=1 Tax=Aneurinibacillus sp. REN35 TaxID=3237286 RepID=UPI003527C148
MEVDLNINWGRNLVFLFRLLLAVVLGGLLGWERERKNKFAGLKTHILVAVSGCLLMWLSLYGFDEFIDRDNVRFDPARLAAQVGGGIGGFLAAGIVFRSDKFTISGYSTAAMLLLAMIIGFAIGGGQYFVSIVTVIVVVLCMVGLPPLKKHMNKSLYQLSYVALPEQQMLTRVTALLEETGITIKDISMDETEQGVTTFVLVSFPPGYNHQDIVEKLLSMKGVVSAKVQ